MYITDGADLDMEDSDDELPSMKFLLDDVPETNHWHHRMYKCHR